jgi:hypothetical protein
LEIEQAYSQYLDSKKVVFVGPATTLIDHRLGEWIDSFDVVVRMNGSYIIPETYQQDFGSKCNILYTNGAFAKRTAHLPINQINGIQFICAKSKRRFYQWNKLLPNRVRQFSKHVPINFEIRGLFTGMQAINELIQYNIKYLYVVGIDFYQHKYNYYGKEYGEDLYTGIPGSHAHDLNRNFQFFKHLYQSHKNMYVDQVFLQDLLKQNYIDFDPSEEVRTLKNKK